MREILLQMFNILVPYGWENSKNLIGAMMLYPDKIYHSKAEIKRLMKLNGFDQGLEFVKPARGMEDGCVNMVCAENQAGVYAHAAQGI